MAGSDTHWRKVFCGREDELAQLIALWEEVRDGKGPRFAAVLADRGMGKTRLVQQLYLHLTQKEDPDNYWPDGLSFIGKDLAPGPDPLRDPVVAAHFESFTINERPMPFLWWGFRLADPDQRNITRASLESHASALAPHLEAMSYARRLKALRKAGVFGLGEDAGGYGKSVVEDLGKAALEGLGAWVGPAKMLIGMGRRSVDYHDEAQSLAHKQAVEDITYIGRIKDRNLQEQIEAPLHDFLLPRDGREPVPMIILVDDAQFAREGGDDGTLKFISALWDFVATNPLPLPLLLISTHWQAEWAAGANEKIEQSFAGCFRRKVTNTPERAHAIALPPHPNLSPKIEAALPKMPEADRALLLERVGGNPLFLDELIDKVLTARTWTDGKGGLSDYARGQIATGSFNVHSLFAERLGDPDRTPIHVRNAVALGATEGMQFLRAVVNEAAIELGIALPETALDEAAEPHAVVELPNAENVAFRQRVLRDVAARLAADHVGDEATIIAALRAAAQRLKANAASGLSVEAERALSGLLVGTLSDTATVDERQAAAKALLELIPDTWEGVPEGTDFEDAVRLAREFESGTKAGHWDREALDPQLVRRAVNVLAMAELKKARDKAAATGTAESRRDVFVSLNKVGDGLSLSQGPSDAIPFWQESLSLSRTIAAEMANAQSYRDVFVALNRLADGVNAVDGPSAALPLWHECLDIARRLATELGAPESKRDLSVALDRVSFGLSATSGITLALPLWQESLEIRRALAYELGTPQSMRDVSVSLEKVGAGLSAALGAAAALPLWMESHEIARALAAELGTPDSKRDVCVALDSVGHGLNATQGGKVALLFWQESLEIRRALVAELGTPDSRRDVSVSLNRVGDALNATQGAKVALPLWQESLEIARALAAELGTPDSRRDVSVSLEKIAIAEAESGDVRQAEPFFRETLGLREILFEQLGTPQAEAELTRAKENLDLCLRLIAERDQA